VTCLLTPCHTVGHVCYLVTGENSIFFAIDLLLFILIICVQMDTNKRSSLVTRYLVQDAAYFLKVLPHKCNQVLRNWHNSIRKRSVSHEGNSAEMPIYLIF
jgi:hypothetical protein